MSDDRPSHPFRSALGLISGALLLALLLAGLGGYRDLEAMRDRAAELERRAAESQARIESLRERIRLLQEDPATLERLARDQLGLVRPGEVVLVLERDLPSPDAAEPGSPPASAASAPPS